MQILSLNDQSSHAVVERTLQVLVAGGLIIFPTETTYGAGVDATNQAAVDKLLAYKSRREGKPLSIAVPDQAMAERYVELNDQARVLYQRFLPGPLTVVSKSKGRVAEGVASEFGTLGVRIPAYPLILELVRAFGKPLTATSANASGEKRPYSVADVLDHISDKQKSLIDLILDAGTLPKNPPSTVIDTTLSTPVTLREGELTFAAAETTRLTSASVAETKTIAGRLLLKHWDAVSTTGVVIGLRGPLGAGKTVFTKGIAEFLQIKETITSPTYIYIDEYDFQRHQTTGKLYHLDLWKVESAEELERLEIGKLLGPNKVMVIEWIDQVWEALEGTLTASSAQVVLVEIAEEAPGRVLTIKD